MNNYKATQAAEQLLTDRFHGCAPSISVVLSQPARALPHTCAYCTKPITRGVCKFVSLSQAVVTAHGHCHDDAVAKLAKKLAA